MISLTHRVYQNEIMDDDTIGYEEFSETLRQIETINKLTSAYRPTIKTLFFFWKKYHAKQSTPLKILDIGCGGGDALRKIHEWADRHQIPVELTGLDLNPWSKKMALEETPKSMKIGYLIGDIFDFKPEEPPHVIINSLFTHHLNDEELIRILKWMTEHALYGWIVNDLHRHPIPYYFIRYFVKIFRFNRLIRNDAPLSVARSFTRKDWDAFIQRAALDSGKIRLAWYWPFRYVVRYAT